MKAPHKTNKSDILNKIYDAIKTAWSWFAILYVPLFSIIQIYITVIPDERALALVTNVVYLELVYGLLFALSLGCVRLYGKLTGIKIKSQKANNKTSVSAWCFVSIVLSLIIVFVTAQLEKNKIKTEAAYYRVPVQNMGFISDGLFGALVSNVDKTDTQIVNVIASAFVPMTFGASLLIGGVYTAYRFSSFVQTQYAGRLLLIVDYKTDCGDFVHPNPWGGTFILSQEAPP